MNDNTYNKVQINRTTRFGVDRFGKKVSETTQMFNIRCDTVDESIQLYEELLKKFYVKNKVVKEPSK